MSEVDRDQFWRRANQYFANDRLELTIMPTEHCNFRCTYCYEDFSIGRMNKKTVSALKDYLASRAAELRQLQIRWFGGEPLIAFDIIEDISSYIAELSIAYPTLRHEGSITTNGWHLDLEKAARLASLNIRSFQITLDGPKSLHDKTRVLANNGGTYDRVHRNLRFLRDSSLDVTIELRLHLTPENLHEIERYADFLGDEYLVDRRFRLEPFPVGHLGGAKDSSFSVLDVKESVSVMRRIRSRHEPKPLSDLDATDKTQPDRYICYAARGNAYVIRADGSIAKCTVAMNDPRNKIGAITGIGEMELEQDRARLWLTGWRNMDWSALQCPLDALQGDQPWNNASVIRAGIKP